MSPTSTRRGAASTAGSTKFRLVEKTRVYGRSGMALIGSAARTGFSWVNGWNHGSLVCRNCGPSSAILLHPRPRKVSGIVRTLFKVPDTFFLRPDVVVFALLVTGHRSLVTAIEAGFSRP